jgi:protein gp37
MNGFDVTLRNHYLCPPKHLKYPRKIFVCSMSDLFNEEVPFEFIDKVMGVVKAIPMHTYQILTKRAERMAEYFATRTIPTNAWLGVSVENKDVMNRIDLLRNLNATVKFLSCEPLIQDLGTMNLQGIDWVIVGGESEDWRTVNRARPMNKEWVTNIQYQCDKLNIAFFFKQWGM